MAQNVNLFFVALLHLAPSHTTKFNGVANELRRCPCFEGKSMMWYRMLEPLCHPEQRVTGVANIAKKKNVVPNVC